MCLKSLALKKHVKVTTVVTILFYKTHDQGAFSSVRSLHPKLLRKATFACVMERNPNSPWFVSCCNLSQATRWTLFQSSEPPSVNQRVFLSIWSHTNLGTLATCNECYAIEDNANCAKFTLPARDMHFYFHPANLTLIFCKICTIGGPSHALINGWHTQIKAQIISMRIPKVLLIFDENWT